MCGNTEGSMVWEVLDIFINSWLSTVCKSKFILPPSVILYRMALSKRFCNTLSINFMSATTHGIFSDKLVEIKIFFWLHNTWYFTKTSCKSSAIGNGSALTTTWLESNFERSKRSSISFLSRSDSFIAIVKYFSRSGSVMCFLCK